MPDDRKYSQDQINAILKRALERGALEGGVSHGELVATAKEIGIAPADLEHAIAEESRERELAEDRDLWIEHRRSRLKQGAITWAFVNAICLSINLLVGGPLWFFWVLVPWGLVLAMLAMRWRTGPSTAQLEAQRSRRQRKLLRAQRRAKWSRNARVLEDVVEQGVNALVSRLDEHRKQIEGVGRRPNDRLPAPDDRNRTLPDKPRGRRD